VGRITSRIVSRVPVCDDVLSHGLHFVDIAISYLPVAATRRARPKTVLDTNGESLVAMGPDGAELAQLYTVCKGRVWKVERSTSGPD
jgi:hypothetical protein